jgi:hypothetical protein
MRRPLVGRFLVLEAFVGGEPIAEVVFWVTHSRHIVETRQDDVVDTRLIVAAVEATALYVAFCFQKTFKFSLIEGTNEVAVQDLGYENYLYTKFS